MTKLLYISNIGGQKLAYSFVGTSIKAAHELNYEYYIVANRSKTTAEQRRLDELSFKVKLLHADINRSPLSKENIKAFKQIVSIIKNEKIDYIHCNTPVGGVLGRLAGKMCNVKRVIYQAHGFHFFKGAPLLNWLLYYPIERWLAHYTDALITINHEDFERAHSFRLRNNGKVYYVPGVGIHTKDYVCQGFDFNSKREELKLDKNDIMVISTGDLIARKNFQTSIKAIALAKDPHLHFFICGQGPQKEELENLAVELGIKEQVHFLGFRTDIKELLWASDIFLFTTFQEGLSRSLLEAMATGLPCIASNIRGNTDLINDGENGFLIEANDAVGFGNALNKLSKDYGLRMRMTEANVKRIKQFDFETVTKALYNIYCNELHD